MKYQKSQMVYQDYKWNARADHDNPKFVGAQERSMLNRSEGYEMLDFIDRLASDWKWGDNLGARQRLEKIIREKVPSNIRTHDEIKKWISSNYKSI
ncbi:hypothetical protein ACQKCH_14785 [Nubsella zeaxanthinifaciens]|uniref:hypothetical protein n=1 Tax=Nubsella zeaxanthinifaciens TaxID=392412 RepID=UPI003D03DDE0